LNSRKLEADDSKVAIEEIITVETLPGLDSEEENLEMSWRIVFKGSQEMLVLVDFEKPLYVSTQGDKDEVKVTIKST